MHSAAGLELVRRAKEGDDAAFTSLLRPLLEPAGIAQTSSPPYWGTWVGSVTPSTPGCYGIQFDGTNVSDVIVIAVTKGPPPPG